MAGLAVFAVGAAAIDARATYGAQVSADEPQYLLTALSLAEDFDLDISDELAAERFRPFHENRLNPQTIDLNEQGQRLSPHDPLLPLLLAPAMGLGGWVAAKLTLAALAALTAMATTWLAIRRFGVSPATAALVIGGFFCAPPLSAYATQVYPEIPAALAVVVGVIAVTGRRTRRAEVVAVLAVVALPWLAVKYVPVAAVLALGLIAPLLRSWPSARWRAVAISVSFAAAGVVYLVVHQRVYGGWTVYATGDHFVDGEFTVVGSNPLYLGRSRRLIGLLIDREFGLIPWNPGYLLALPALAYCIRIRIRHRWLLGGLIAAGWATATWVALTMHGWWWPGRQVVVILPIVVLMMAVAVDGRPRLLAATMGGVALGVITWLWLVVEASTGRRTLIVDFVDTANPWYRAWSQIFPTQGSFAVTGFDLVLTTIWTVVMLFAAAAVWSRSRPGVDPGGEP